MDPSKKEMFVAVVLIRAIPLFSSPLISINGLTGTAGNGWTHRQRKLKTEYRVQSTDQILTRVSAIAETP
jgi:hypothetical protein